MPKAPRSIPRPMKISTAVAANDTIRSFAIGSRRRHNSTANVATIAIPTNDAVEVRPWNTAVSPRWGEAGTWENDDRAVSPAGSDPQNSHHQADATAIGTTAIAA